jgi:hypothetical protein
MPIFLLRDEPNCDRLRVKTSHESDVADGASAA